MKDISKLMDVLSDKMPIGALIEAHKSALLRLENNLIAGNDINNLDSQTAAVLMTGTLLLRRLHKQSIGKEEFDKTNNKVRAAMNLFDNKLGSEN